MASENHETATADEGPRLTAEEAKVAHDLISQAGTGNGTTDAGKDSLLAKLDSIASFNA